MNIRSFTMHCRYVGVGTRLVHVVPVDKFMGNMIFCGCAGINTADSALMTLL